MLKQDNLRIPLFSVMLLVAVCFCWGGNMVSIKVTVSSIPPLLTATLRSIGALALLWCYALWRGERVMPRRRDIGHGTVIGLLLAGFLLGINFYRCIKGYHLCQFQSSVGSRGRPLSASS